jgi:hypothetical protein
MWLMTRLGFFSVVCARQAGGESGTLDPDTLMVRARSKRHLTNLIGRYPEQLGGADIRADAGTEYPYRIIVAKPVWRAVMGLLTDELDYGNFKNEVSAAGLCDLEYSRALADVWLRMRELEDKFR